MSTEDAAAVTADAVVARINSTLKSGAPLTLSVVEVAALADFVNARIAEASEHAQMVHIISHRAYGQQSEMVH